MDEAKPPAGNKGPLMLDSIEPIVNQKSPPDSPQNLKSNTMEAQSLPLDLKKPRNAPQLIGLTSLNYKPSELEHTTTERSPEKNLRNVSMWSLNRACSYFEADGVFLQRQTKVKAR